MFLDIDKSDAIPNIQEAISVNREILCFFRGVSRDHYVRSIDDLCPDGTSFRDNIIKMCYELNDPVNVSILFNRLVKATRQKKLRGDIDSLYSELYAILLSQKTHIFQYNWDAQGVGNALYGLQNSSNVPIELFLAFAQVVPRIKNWNTQEIGMALYGLQNSSNVPTELFLAFAQVIPHVHAWDAQGVGNALYGLQNSSNVPDELLQAFAQVVPKISNWSAQETGLALFGISHLEGGVVDGLIGILLGKTHLLDIENEGFAQIQSLIIGLNHASVEVPEKVQSRWDDLVNTEGRHYSTTTRDEQDLMEYIKDNFGEDFEFLSGAYVQGYEVDILILDFKGQVFAIIESDGGIHNIISKKNKSQKRDQYFLREGVTDLLIRVSANGCRVIASEN